MASLPQPASAADYFAIQVIDEATGRGVPLVELRTVNNIRYDTDSAGRIAFDEPGLMDQEVFFHVRSHGYEYPADGFGFRGIRLKTTAGGSAQIRLKRLNVAERLYRVTGGGIYRDSLLLGEPVPLDEPVLNARVTGSDSVVNAVFNGRIYWFWGDTNLPKYPLGIFHVPGATSALPSAGGLDPSQGVNLHYFQTPEGTARATAKMPGEGPTWIDGLTVLPGEDGRQRLFAGYAKIKPPLSVYERGIVEFDTAAQEFRKVQTFPPDVPLFPGGHPLLAADGGVTYVYFAQPFPSVRVRATPEAFVDLSAYETFTCLKAGSRLDDLQVDRRADATVAFAWKPETPALNSKARDELIQSGKLRPEEMPLRLNDIESGKTIHAHSGSVCWNGYRQRYVMIVLQTYGTSVLGEIWYAEAPTPVGPWGFARKIVTHDNYSFYNPKQHPMFDQDGGRVIFFEGTYTHTFSGNPDPTPRYDYNQIMYRLDLADERLVLPVPVSRIDENGSVSFRILKATSGGGRLTRADFYALDRPVAGSIPIYQEQRAGQTLLSPAPPSIGVEPLFYAMPPGDTGVASSACLVPLYATLGDETEGATCTTIRPQPTAASVLCRVWQRPPVRRSPVADP